MPPGVRLPRLLSRVLLPCAVASVAIVAFWTPAPKSILSQFHSDVHFQSKPQSQNRHHVQQQPHSFRDTTLHIPADMASRANLRVLICGGGIAGNTLAFWLTKLGHNVTVLERYPHLRATGLQ